MTSLWSMEIIHLLETRIVAEVVDDLSGRFDRYGVLERCLTCEESCVQYAVPDAPNECWKYPGPLFAEKLRQMAEKAA